MPRPALCSSIAVGGRKTNVKMQGRTSIPVPALCSSIALNEIMLWEITEVEGAEAEGRVIIKPASAMMQHSGGM